MTFTKPTSSLDLARIVSVTIFTHDPATLVLDHEFGLLGAGEFAAALDGVRPVRPTENAQLKCLSKCDLN